MVLFSLHACQPEKNLYAKEWNMKAKILILDDDGQIRHLLGQILRENGYSFETASDASKARELLKKQNFELILCDIDLPGESGIDFTRFARSEYPHTAIVMVTGNESVIFFKISLELGAYDYIIKPFNKNRVLFSIANALQRRELEIANRTFREDLEKMVAEKTANLEGTNLKLKQAIAKRESAQKVLKENEQKYHLLINNIPGSVYKGYKDWSVDFFDNKIAESTGYKKEEFDSRKLIFSDIIFKEDIKAAKKTILEALNASDTYIREYRIKTKTGKILWIQDRGQIIHNQKGEIEYFSGVFFDITKQKQAEEQLRQNERYYRSILANMHESIAVINREYQITDVNTTFLTTIGCSREEAVGRYCYEVSHGYSEPCDRYGEECNLPEVFATGEPWHYLHELTAADGSKVWLDIILSPFRDDQNNITHVIEAARDVTEQKRIEEAFRESEERHRTIMETCADPIVVYDGQGLATYINPAFNRVFGWTSEELLGKRIDFVPEEAVAETQKAIKKVFQDGRLTGFETRRYTKSGHTIDARLGAALLRDANAAPVGMVVNFQDITEESKKAKKIKLLNKQLIKKTSQIESKNRELEQTLKQLEDTQSQILQSEKMASIGQLAAGVAHEINNPTGFVSSNLKALSEYIKDINGLTREYKKIIADLKENTAANGGHPAISEHVERITALEEEVDIDFILNDIFELIEESREGTERIKNIVQDLKDFAHPGEDKPKFADINNNLDSTVNVVQNELKYKADVIKDYGDLPQVQCYPQLLNQVFMNLLVNAAQSIEERGEIRIKTRADNGYAEIKISDTGAGIPKESLSKIFDPFFTTKEVGKGTGLGLNVAYNIIEKHQGTIDVDSTVGAGTAFTIRIPVE